MWPSESMTLYTRPISQLLSGQWRGPGTKRSFGFPGRHVGRAAQRWTGHNYARPWRLSDTGPQHRRIDHQRAGIRNPSHDLPASPILAKVPFGSKADARAPSATMQRWHASITNPIRLARLAASPFRASDHQGRSAPADLCASRFTRRDNPGYGKLTDLGRLGQVAQAK